MSSRQAASRPPRVATQPRRRHVDSDSSLSTSPSSIQPRRQRAADPPHPQTPSRHSNPHSRHSSSSDSSGLQLSSGPSNPSLARPSARYSPSQRENLSPSTSLCARSSVETYSSLASAEDLVSTESQDAFDFDDSDIPELPPYKHEIEDYNVRASSPNEFPTLFPSLDRLSIRHDDFTSDGNMNLRIETRIPGRHKEIAQLFHLRMYDLNKREFSLRRYCRSSGREICNSKRRYQDTTDDARPTFQRSMSNAFQSLASRPKARRMSTAASIRSTKSMKSRPGTSYSTSGSLGGGFADVFDDEFAVEKKPKARLQPTNTIKLEFSNYARIDLERVGAQDSGKWQYEWWGTNYVWKRVVDRHTDAVSFHLIRDGNKATPVAHIVAETRAPNQVMVDECAGGWIPPCHMWISDPSIIDATTDVADVIVATGLLALVDDCIRIRWQGKKHNRLDHSQAENPRSFVQKLFTRRPSEAGPSPLRFQRAGVAL